MRDAIGDMSGVIETSVRGMDTVKTYGAQEYAQKLFYEA